MRKQGDRPTCVGFAVSAAHEWIADDGVVRSPEDAIWAGHQEDGSVEEATSVRHALAGLGRLQHATESAWPYGAPAWPAARPQAAQDPLNRRVLPAWKETTPFDMRSVATELASANAVVLTIAIVPGAWDHLTGVVDAEPGRRAPERHAVLAVGILDEGVPTERVIIKNSWGDRWGDGGYGFITSRYVMAYSARLHVLER